MINRNDMVFRHLKEFAYLSEKELNDSKAYWKVRKIKKGDFLSMQETVCSHLNLVVKGIVRIFYHEPNKKEDKNVYFFSENQFVVSFRSFVSREACSYSIEALEDSEILHISYKDLNILYETHRNWERFGRLLAESFFNIAQTRSEEFIFFSPEQRYLRLREQHPQIVERIPAYHISSYLGITNPSLSRIRKRIEEKIGFL